MMTQRITITPDSPTRGVDYNVCYDFSGMDDSVTYVVLKGTHTPAQAGDPVLLTINRSPDQAICESVLAPTGADGVLWVDTQYGSPSAGATFS